MIALDALNAVPVLEDPIDRESIRSVLRRRGVLCGQHVHFVPTLDERPADYRGADLEAPANMRWKVIAYDENAHVAGKGNCEIISTVPLLRLMQDYLHTGRRI